MYCKIICIGILWEPRLDIYYVFNEADSVDFRIAKTKNKKHGNANPKTAVGECYLKKNNSARKMKGDRIYVRK